DIFSYFVTTASITGSPKVIPAIAIMLLCAWVVKEGIEVMGRFASLFLILFVCIIAIGVIFMIPKMEINNLRPIFNEGIKPTIEGAIYTIGFPLSESVIFIMIFTPSKTGNSPNKIYIKALLIAGLILFITSLSEFLVLGTDEYTKTYFPAYKAVSRINIGDFIQRMEIIPAAAYVIGGFVKLSICLLAITNGVAKLCNCRDYRLIVTPITLLMINGSLFATSSMMHLFAWTEEIWTTFSLPFQVILPIMIWIAAEIKKKKIKAVNPSMQK
ncbi:MAG: endospore germination permease, partial [Clostridia bacterium]|nr:endospore germination permease [Clostridia bacterium]